MRTSTFDVIITAIKHMTVLAKNYHQQMHADESGGFLVCPREYCTTVRAFIQELREMAP